MAARIEDQLMTAEFGGRINATARYSSQAAADGQGGGSCWVSPAAGSAGTRRSRRWCSLDASPRATVTNDLFVMGWREELGL
jgi:hypothetical protein